MDGRWMDCWTAGWGESESGWLKLLAVAVALTLPLEPIGVA